MSHLLSSAVSMASQAPPAHDPDIQPTTPATAAAHPTLPYQHHPDHHHPPSPHQITLDLSLAPTTPSHPLDAAVPAPATAPFSSYPPAARTYSSLRPIPTDQEADPLLLRSRLVEESEIRRRHSGNGRNKRAERMVRNFYSAQNQHINRLLKPMSKHAADHAHDLQASALRVKVAVYASMVANFALAALQLYAAVSSLSLSLFATAADSVFDPFANLVLNWLHRKAANVDERKWPIGGSRFEPIGNITYAAIMGMVSAILIVQSIQELAKGEQDRQLHVPALVAVAVAFGTKLVLFLYCFGLRRFSSQVEVLCQDHRNDLFINGLGIFTSAAGATIAGWMDPAGGLVISLAILVSWTRTAYGEFQQLAGLAAPTEFLQLVTYNAAVFSDEILAIESVRAYSSGPKYTVEMDVVMHPETPLWKSHDVAQLLQDSLEDLPMVERAFIHVDHEVEHAFEHKKAV
ncbi:hypothetical protein ACQY0O_005527 [Thecaphora frezii]